MLDKSQLSELPSSSTEALNSLKQVHLVSMFLRIEKNPMADIKTRWVFAFAGLLLFKIQFLFI